MTRKCSHCSKIGHNSRTCAGFRSGSAPTTTTTCESVRLFGVQIGTSHSSSSTHQQSTSLAAFSIKCLSLDCISSSASSSPSMTSSPLSSSRFVVEENPDVGASINDFLFDGILPRSQYKIKKGVLWSEDEHKQFLMGLEKLGKGDWRGISKHFVLTRTPTQVASHAQKYYLRQASLDNKKRRSSLFDMVGGKSNDQIPKRNNPIPTDQDLSRRTTPSSSNQQLVNAPHSFDLSFSLLSNNANHSSVSSSSSLCPKHTPIDLDLTLAAPRPSPPSSSTFGTMKVT